MIAKREVRQYSNGGTVWVGKYKNSHNLLHWHPDCELLYVERGSIDVFCERKSHLLTTRQSLFIDSEQIHSMKARERNTVLIVFIFNPNIVKRITGDRLASPVLGNDYDIPSVYRSLYGICAGKAPFCDAEAACKVMQLMIEIYRREPMLPQSAATNRTTQSFKKLLEEMNGNYATMTFQDAAAFMGMSEAYFSRYFHASAGNTFSQQLNYAKIDAAINMLHGAEDLTITEISDRCGFSTIRNFNRIFKELTGYSPKTLPQNFSLDGAFHYADERTSDPTLYDCELIESPFLSELTSS